MSLENYENMFKRDFTFGCKSENELKELLNNNFGKVYKTLSQYDVMDYTNDKVDIEIKTRRKKKNDFKTTMICKNKFDYAEKSKKDVYFIFCYIDGVYYWKYNKEDIKNGLVKFDLGGRWDRQVSEIKIYGYIPVDILTELK
jgi:hypothetical protein